MLDQNLALQWVQENIHHFGGDPSNVMIHGQSSGAISVKYHSLSPLSGQGDDQLFHKVVVHSGQQMAYNPDPLDTAKSFAQHVGCLREFNKGRNEFIDCIQSASVEDVLKVQSIKDQK